MTRYLFLFLLALAFATPLVRADRSRPRVMTPTGRLWLVEEKPTELVANEATVFILDGKEVTPTVFFGANATVTEVHLADDGKTIRKIVATTKKRE